MLKELESAWSPYDRISYDLIVFLCTSISDESMKQKLDEGCVDLSVSPGAFTSVGHFILIYGYDENGYFVNDPKCVARSRQTWTMTCLTIKLNRFGQLKIVKKTRRKQ